jgi:hypothetical protein
MRLLLVSAFSAVMAAGVASAGTSSVGATVTGSSSGIGNNSTVVYKGPNMTGAVNSAVNSASIVQAGFLNGAWVAQAGNTAIVHAPSSGSYINILSPVANISTGGGNINLSGMFQLLNTTNSIGDTTN